MAARSRPRVLAAMSGGVDSSVAAALLVRAGHDVVGVTMKLFKDGGDLPDRPCCSLDSVNDARRVCEHLGIPHYVLNLQDAFGRALELQPLVFGVSVGHRTFSRSLRLRGDTIAGEVP